MRRQDASFLVALLLAPLCCGPAARAAEPPTAPQVRIETGMHTAMIKRIAVNQAQRLLATASHDKTARVWDLDSGRPLHILRPPTGPGNEGNAAVEPRHWRAVCDAPGPETPAKEASAQATPLYRALDQAGLRAGPRFEQAYHVAVDRWTGAAADAFLYSALEPLEVAWEPLRLTLDLARLDRAGLLDPGLALVLLLLRDLKARRLPLGFGVNRGYGALEVEGFDLAVEEGDAALEWLNVAALGDVGDLPPEPLDALQTSWQAWLDDPSRVAPVTQGATDA